MCVPRLLALAVLLLAPAAFARPSTRPAAADFQEDGEALLQALDAGDWSPLPREIERVHALGPTPATPVGVPGEAWFATGDLDRDPAHDPDAEAAFRRSVEAAHAGRTRLIEGGRALLIDPAGRVWAVAEHAPHLLRCYDGARWTYRRADGLPIGEGDAAEAFMAAPLPEPDYAAGGLRDRNDLGRWYVPAAADAGGNLHFLASCESTAAAAEGGTGGAGVHTLRPDGTWGYFPLFPADADTRLHGQLRDARFTVHEGRDPAGDLVTLAEFRLSDPVAATHGHGVVPIPQTGEPLRHQSWKEHAEDPRHGPLFLLRFDGDAWRVERTVSGWGVYDGVWLAWLQPDGRAYLANRFGLWLDWPRRDVERRVNYLADEILKGGNPAASARAAQDLAALAGPALPHAEARLEKAKLNDVMWPRLSDALDALRRTAEGRQDAVPVVAGRWRFTGIYPQATTPDGRFAFHCDEAVDVRADEIFKDCYVVFDPAAGEAGAFEVRRVDAEQWQAAGYRGGTLSGSYPISTAIDRDGGLWGGDGWRMDADGTLARLAPPGLDLSRPEFADAAGRVYAEGRGSGIRVYRIGTAAPAGDGEEVVIEGVSRLFRQRNLPAPWHAWAVRSPSSGGPRLLRLDGPEPTAVELPPELVRVHAVVPLKGGCLVVGSGRDRDLGDAARAAWFWNGEVWDVAPDVKTLVERHGGRLAAMAPTRAFAEDTSTAFNYPGFDPYLLLASDGRGGLWLGEDAGGGPLDSDPADGRRGLWHWADGEFTDLWRHVPLPAVAFTDSGFLTTADGQGLLVLAAHRGGNRPGGLWSVHRVTPEDVAAGTVPHDHLGPGLHVELLAGLGPNTRFADGLWADQDGWVWSPLFGEDGDTWVRRLGSKHGRTSVPNRLGDTLVQPPGGRTWFKSPARGGGVSVWADVSSNGPEPEHYKRDSWAGLVVPGAQGPSRLAAAPDGRVFLLHAGGISLLRVERDHGTTQPATTRPATRQAAPTTRHGPDAHGWRVVEVARRPWAGPRNDFGVAGFDETGVWLLSDGGTLIRTPLPVP